MTSLLISFNKQLLSIFSVENSLFYIYNILNLFTKYQGASLVAQSVKNLPAMQETQVQFLGQEDPLEKEMTTQSSILPGESHGQRILVGCSPWGCKELETTE